MMAYRGLPILEQWMEALYAEFARLSSTWLTAYECNKKNMYYIDETVV